MPIVWGSNAHYRGFRFPLQGSQVGSHYMSGPTPGSCVHLIQHHVLQLLVVHRPHEDVSHQRLPDHRAWQILHATSYNTL